MSMPKQRTSVNIEFSFFFSHKTPKKIYSNKLSYFNILQLLYLLFYYPIYYFAMYYKLRNLPVAKCTGILKTQLNKKTRHNMFTKKLNNIFIQKPQL